eukprot:6617560-Pyramimonas_sp.AAC.1
MLQRTEPTSFLARLRSGRLPGKHLRNATAGEATPLAGKHQVGKMACFRNWLSHRWLRWQKRMGNRRGRASPRYCLQISTVHCGGNVCIPVSIEASRRRS